MGDVTASLKAGSLIFACKFDLQHLTQPRSFFERESRSTRHVGFWVSLAAKAECASGGLLVLVS